MEPNNKQKYGGDGSALAYIWIAALQISPSELTIDIKDEPEEIRSEPAPPGMD
jgi:hypothetical protein